MNTLPAFRVDDVKSQASGLLGRSAVMHELREIVFRVAAVDCIALIHGESGVGKELVARALHTASARSNEPFVALNCGAIPPDLMESEIFGHERGAFTGAHSTRIGRFEAAGSGTLFLDEIAEMSMPMQVKLLRVLQERTFERVGSHTVRRLEARVIAATHRDLRKRVAEGRFREDLFYRIHVVPIVVPPLRERGDDVLLLARHALDRLAARGAPPVRFGPGVREALMDYRWPGNVRELFNLMERWSVLHAGGTIRVSDLPPHMQPQSTQNSDCPHCSSCAHSTCIREDGPTRVPPFSAGDNLKSYLEAIERQMIVNALQTHHGVVARAADSLGLRRTTFIERMNRLGVVREPATPQPRRECLDRTAANTTSPGEDDSPPRLVA